MEVMKKEEALLEELARMNEEKTKKDEENEKLRQQLTSMKVKMEQVSLLKYFRCFSQFNVLGRLLIELYSIVHTLHLIERLS